MAALACFLLACVRTAFLHETRIPWEDEPVVGIAEPSLAASTKWALNQWEWGRFHHSCDGADICVKRGFLFPGTGDKSLGRAFWPGEGNACDAVVYRPAREAVVVAHEIGHCFGMDHSQHSHSVMSATINVDPDYWYWVTYDDIRVLERIK